MVKKKSGRPAGKIAIISKVDKLLAKIVEYFGSQTEAANAIGCSQSHIWSYLGKRNKASLPPIMALQIEVASNGAFDCEELSPELAELLSVIASNRNKNNQAALGAVNNKG